MNFLKRRKQAHTRKIVFAGIISGIISSVVTLFAKSKKGQETGRKVRDFATEKAHQAGAKISEMAEKVKNKANDTTHDAAVEVESKAAEVKKNTENR